MSAKPTPNLRRISRGQWLLVIAGLILTQVLLCGPSLVGTKVLLALDFLEQPGIWLPADPTHPGSGPSDRAVSDPVYQFEPARQFAVSEVRHGRIPLWNPYQYAGSPFVAANQTAVFSPYRIIDYVLVGPIAIAWTQVAKALVAGLGAFLYFRLVLRVRFFPALIGAWCYPLTGALMFHAGHPHSAVITWLPLLFLATENILRRPGARTATGMALVIAAILLSGHIQTAAFVLLAAGAYWTWRWCRLCRIRRWPRRSLRAATMVTIAAVVCGVLLSGPQTFPTLEYLPLTHRIASRAHEALNMGHTGFAAIGQMLIPDSFGSTQRGWVYLLKHSRIEDGAAGYAGLFGALLFAPLAFLSKRNKSTVVCLALLGLFGLGQHLNIPHWINPYEIPPLSLLRPNRLIFVTGWCVLALGVIGLDAWIKTQTDPTPVAFKDGKQIKPDAGWKRWAKAGALPGAACAAWCLWQSDQIWNHIESILAPLEGTRAMPPESAFPDFVSILQSRWDLVFAMGAMFSAIIVMMWLSIATRTTSPLKGDRWFPFVAGCLWLFEMMITMYGVYPSADPSLYYPSLPLLVTVQTGQQGRILPVGVMPPGLLQTQGLTDIRGFDGLDPRRMIDLMEAAQSPSIELGPEYAMSFSFAPASEPIADLMGIRYVIHRDGSPPPHSASVVMPDAWLAENPRAMPRAFVPTYRVTVPNARECLERMKARTFDPSKAVYIEPTNNEETQKSDPVGIVGPIRGTAIVDPKGATFPDEFVTYDMETPGTVVVTELWYPGWKAYVNGVESPVLIADHAFRGVDVPRGAGVIQFVFDPWSFKLGVILSAVTGTLLVWWNWRDRTRLITRAVR